MLTHCELFGGIGGFSCAIKQWFPEEYRTTGYCDIDEWAIEVYKSHFPDVPIHRDIRYFRPERGEYDLLTITFPCTGTSVAGKREGLEHPDSALWREGLRILYQVQPKYAIWEQPMGIIDRGLRELLGGIRGQSAIHGN